MVVPVAAALARTAGKFVANAARKSIKKKVVPTKEILKKTGRQDFFRIPDESRFFANAIPANDDQPSTGKVVSINKDRGSKNRPSDGSENLKNVGGVFVNDKRPETERGNKLVIENPAFPKEAEGTISEETKKLLENPNFKKLQTRSAKDNEQNLQSEEFADNDASFDNREYLQNQINQEFENEEVVGNRGAAEKLVYFPPIIIISLTLIEYISLFIVGLVGIIFTFILPPVGLIISIGIYFWKIFFNGTILIWSLSYDFQSEQKIKSLKYNSILKKITNILSNKRKLKLLGKITGKGKWVIFSLVVSIFPLVDLIWPTSVILAFQASRAKKKIVDEYNKSIEENN